MPFISLDGSSFTPLVHRRKQNIPLSVMPGLDQTRSGHPPERHALASGWIAGSSPAMTRESSECVIALAEPPGDVVFGPLVSGTGEDLIGHAVLDHLAQ